MKCYSKEIKNIVKEMLEAPRLRSWTRTIKNKPKLNKLILDTSFLKKNSRITERIFCVQNNIFEPVSCSSCNKKISFDRSINQYHKYCSSCLRTTQKYKEKVKQTNLERYGVEHYQQTNECKEKVKRTTLERYGVEHYAKTKECKEKTKQTSIEKYGVENYAQTKECQEKIKQTNLERYGVKHYAKTKECHDKMKQTSLEKYGVEYYTQTDEYKEKAKQTNLEKYGVVNPFQADQIKEKVKQTNLERYGVEYYQQTDEYKEKIKQTNLEKYGVVNPFQSEQIKEKIKQANLKRYGVEYYTQTKECHDKMKQTNLERYGVVNPFQADQIKEKVKQTSLERYGVEYYAQTKECHDKMKQTSLERYGVEHYTQTDEYKKRAKQTSLERYGVEYYAQTKECHEQVQKTSLEKYGVEHYTQTDEYKKRAKQTSLERYGVEHYQQKHIPQEILDKLNDKDWMYNEHAIKEKPLIQISDELNLSPTIAGRYLKKHNIEARHFNVSQQEKELQEYISSLISNVIINTRSIISPLELDIYLPKHNLAFEFNGLYWHSQAVKQDKFYHINKTIACKEQGVNLIHIFENEWLFKQDIIKSMINSLLNSNKKINANECQIKEIDYEQSKSFLDRTHIQGNTTSEIQIGLFYNEDLISVMTFNKLNDEHELLRFGSELNIDVVSAENKLFKYFIEEYKPKSVISYNNLRYGNDNIYNNLGFECSHIIEPDYFYFKGYEIITRNQLLEEYDSNLTEYKIITEHGYDKIYDCGNSVWIYK